MPGPLVALAPIVTAVGRFAVPYLAKELGKIGSNKFVQTYGNEAFTSLNETLIKNTTMVNFEAMPMVNPSFKAPGVIAPDAEEMEREAEKIREMTKPIGFPADPSIKPDIKTGETTPPKIDTVEELPAEDRPLPKLPGFGEGDKIDIPLITYSKDAPKNLKDLVDRSVGQEKGEKAIEKIYDDSIFDNVLDGNQLRRMRQLEENYTGGLADLGDAGIPLILENSLLDQHEEYMKDYQEALANAARETLGNEFKAYRLMEKNDAINMLTKGEFPNTKRLQEDEDGNEVYKDIIIDMMGQKTPLSREAFSFSLSPKEALSFRYLSAGDRGSKKDEDFVLIEMKASPTDIVMRGHESEKDLVLRVDGNVAGDRVVTPNLFNVYDVNFGEKNQVQLLENKDYKNFVDASKNKLSNVSTQTEKLVRGIGDNNPPSAIEEETTVSKTTPKEYKGEIIETTSLNENLKEAIAKYAGTPEDIAKSTKMPQSHKRKIYIQLEEYLNENYPSKLSEKEQEVESDALFYIANSVYDIYTFRGEGMPNNTLMVQDDIGFPLATAEIERYPKGKLNYYPRRKKGNRYVKTEPAIYIETIGSLNTDATSMILDQIEKIAEMEEVRYIVAEDLTSEAAAKAFEKRGFVPAKKGFFEGDIINEADWRGGRKNVKQKNMVLDLGKKYQTTEKEIGEDFIKEQTDNLLKKK